MHDLHPRERVLLALVTGYCKNGGACLMSNAMLGDWLGVSPRQIQKYLVRLVDRELVYMTHNPQREIRSTHTNHRTPPHEPQDTPPTNHRTPTHELQDTHIRKNNKMDNKHHNGEREKIPSVEDATATLGHLVDTLDDCRHVPKHALSSMARDCLNYYESNDWRTKRGDEIRRWRPVLENWLRRNAKQIPKRNVARKEYTMRDVEWHERRSESWRNKADQIDVDDPRREDWLKYANEERNAAMHIRQQILRNAKNAP